MNSERKDAIRKKVKRSQRVRAGLAKKSKPRLSIFRSARHISAQIIDDLNHVTLIGLGSYNKELSSIKNSMEVAKAVGEKLAVLAKEKNIDSVIFDRGPYKYHGRIAALAEGAREAGLKF